MSDSTHIQVSEVTEPELEETSVSPADGSEVAEGNDGGHRLEEEGDVAADYLEELLDIADIDGDIDIEVRNGRSYVSIVTEGADPALNALVGHSGEILDSLQELARLNVLTTTGHRSRLVLDIAGYRNSRAGDLQSMAERAVQEAKQSGEPVHLEPLGAYERKLVHDVVAELGLHSESEGEGSNRHIVVSVSK